MAALVERARRWVAEVHPHARHLERTLDWLLVLAPDAGEPLRIAAITHDIERAFPAPAGEQPPGARDPARSRAYDAWHQARCARIVAGWLRDQGAAPAVTAEVAALVGAHEDGGWPEADLLQAADSLSFLEVQADLFARFVAEGRLTRAAAQRKVQWMFDRMRVPYAAELGGPLLERARALVAVPDRPQTPDP